MSRPAWWMNDKPSRKKIKAALALYAPAISKKEIFGSLHAKIKSPLTKKQKGPIIKPF